MCSPHLRLGHGSSSFVTCRANTLLWHLQCCRTAIFSPRAFPVCFSGPFKSDGWSCVWQSTGMELTLSPPLNASCHGRGDGTRSSLRFFPIQTILRCCDPVILALVNLTGEKKKINFTPKPTKCFMQERNSQQSFLPSFSRPPGFPAS